MPQFGDYAHFYNLLYRDKDYSAECGFVLSLLQKYGKKPRTLLDLGCGTARHDVEFAKLGIEVAGVDKSPEMLGIAKDVVAAANLSPAPTLFEGDVRDIRLNRKFDAVVSLFHVASYQTTESDCLALLGTACAHLDKGGLFLADFWFGPAVLHLRPEDRVKVMEDDNVHVTRKATPHLDVDNDLVTVRYDVALRHKRNGELREFSEEHKMRYWFLPELRHLGVEENLPPLASGAWLSELPPAEQDWAAWMLFRKI